jgi:hypothetical protein
LQVWGFPICAGAVILLGSFAGVLTLVLMPLLVWTFVLYVRCTREAIKDKHEKKD